MKNYRNTSIVCIVLLGGLTVSADLAAAEGGFFSRPSQAQKPAAAVVPSTVNAPLPAVESPVQTSAFPMLPLSQPCHVADMPGLWKLNHVYEEPKASETSAFNLNPMQYIFFRPIGVYGKFNTPRVGMQPQEVIQEIKSHSTGLLQYLTQDSGLVYFYQDKVATEVQSCFIVVKGNDAFPQGDMILMPPKGQINGRLVKDYTKIWSRPQRGGNGERGGRGRANPSPPNIPNQPLPQKR